MSFVGTPPTETTADQATATIQADDPGTDDITVTLTTAGGTTTSDTVEKDAHSGGDVIVDSRVTIREFFNGRVLSAKSKCESPRKVILQKRKHHDWTKVGHDKTKDGGKWKIHKDNPNGKYRAKVKKKTYLNNDGETIVCGKDKSPLRYV